MKFFTKLFFFIFIAATAVSCASDKSGEDTVEATDEKAAAEATAASQSFSINSDVTTLTWTGSKKVAGSHTGTINVSEGSLAVENGMISSGKFTVDMNSISETNEDADMKAKLEGHLKSPDFFDTEQFPTASFEVTGVSMFEGNENSTHMIAGNLTVKGITKNISFPAAISIEGSKLAAKANFTINRADFEVKYGSKSFFGDLIDDHIINDNISFDMNLMATAQ